MHQWHDTELKVTTQGETDFWQGTHYGFRRDNGHCLLTNVEHDFSLTARVTVHARGKYDQGGILIRLDAENWLKAAVEAESKSTSKLGSVVTNLGYSDWASVDIDADITTMWYRVQSKGADVLLACSEDGNRWRQMRIAHLHLFHGSLAVGVYACSPTEGEGCTVIFDHIHVSFSQWSD
jgi:regulation of enolase protein 1 (concanavalin A-like superfamily)